MYSKDSRQSLASPSLMRIIAKMGGPSQAFEQANPEYFGEKPPAWTPFKVGNRVAIVHELSNWAFCGTLVRRDVEDYEGRAQWFIEWDDGAKFGYSFPEKGLYVLG